MTKDEVVNRLKELAINLGTPRLRLEDIQSVKGLGYHMSKHFTGLAVALKAAGLEPTPLAEKMGTSNKELLNYLLNLGNKNGRRPTVMDVRRDKRFSEVIFAKRFGNIKKAYELAMNASKSQPIEEQKMEYFVDFPNKPLYWGKATELYIVAELMYQGFNANLLPVDLGVDAIATKDNKTFYFQIKSVSFDKTTSRTIPITISSFLRNQSGNMFYVFVLQNIKMRNVLILPYQIIDSLIRKKLISFNKENKDFSICISLNDKVVKIHAQSERANSEDVSSYLDAWDIIV